MEYDRKKRKYGDTKEGQRSSRKTSPKRRRLYSGESQHRSWRSSPCKDKNLFEEIKKVAYRVESIENKLSELNYEIKELKNILERREKLPKPKKGAVCVLM